MSKSVNASHPLKDDQQQKLADVRARMEKVNIASLKTAGPSDAPSSRQIQANPPHLDGVGDMSQLIHLEVENVVHNLDIRYSRQQIYTSVQSITIAVNPYEKLDIYSDEWMAKYRSKPRAELARTEPHLYQVAEKAYQNLSRAHEDQSMVICGESGSGKTESAKVFMRYLAQATGERKEAAGSASVEERFLQVNPVLEALGNAQTNMNNNSSRFGKFTKVLFEKAGKAYSELSVGERRALGKQLPRPKLIGSYVETYLLEKSRVVHQEKGERNYHVFYQMCTGAPADWKAAFKLEAAPNATEGGHIAILENFHYTNQSGSYEIPDVDDGKNFDRLLSALGSLEFSEEERKQVVGLLAGILHLSNIEFTEVSADECLIETEKAKAALETAAECFGLDVAALKGRLTSRNIKVGVQVIAKPLNASAALDNRDAMAKGVYHGLFDRVVKRINKVLFPSDQHDPIWIGILDVFGFECSEFNNSFEQFCINFANERLQQFFNDHVVMSEEAEYLREALPWTPLDIKDNSDTIALIQKRPKGLIPTLDAACLMPKGNDEMFLRNLFDNHRRHPRIKQARTRNAASNNIKSRRGSIKERSREKFIGFIIDHYAGKVCYNAEGFIVKNTDNIHPDTGELFKGSSKEVVASVVAEPKAAGKGRRRSSVGGFASVGSQFQTQLEALMITLRGTTPHFVRCINPNQFKMAQAFDKDYVTPQLVYGGLLEALRILKLGYPSKVPYDSIFERYGHVIPSLNKPGKNTPVQQKLFTEAVFLAFGADPDAYQLGLTKVFFKPGRQEWLETVLGENPELSPEMIKKVKTLMFRRRFSRLRSAINLVARVKIWISQSRTFHRLTRAAGRAVAIHRAFFGPDGPIERLHKKRAAVVLQSFVRAHNGVQHRKRAVLATKTLQDFSRFGLRKAALRAELNARVADTRQKQAAAAQRIFMFYRKAVVGRSLTAEIDKRVESTRKRKEELARMEEEARRKEEEERLRRLAEEKKRLEEEERKRQEEEKKRLEEEARRAKEAEERARKEAEDRRRAMEEAEKKALEEEQRRLKEEQERARKEQEELERERAEKQRLREEKRRKELAWEKAQELKREKEAQEAKQHAEKEERERRLLEQQEQARRDRELEEKLEDRRAEELAAQEQEEAEARAQVETNDKSAAVVSAEEKKAEASAKTKKKYSIPSNILAEHMAEKKQQASERAEEQARRLRHVLLSGGKFLKYGRRGKPHIKYVALNGTGQLHWSDKPIDPTKALPSQTYISLKNVIHILPGRETPTFHRRVAAKAPPFLCFSVVSTERTLDLQAVNVKERDLWIKAIESAVNDVRSGVIDMLTGEKASDVVAAKKESTSQKKKLQRSATLQPRQLQQMAKQREEEMQRMSELHSFETEKQMLEFCKRGGEFLRFESRGKPQIIYVECTKDKLFWGPQPQPSKHEHRSIELRDVSDIRAGKHTGVFQYRSTNALSPPENCFSLIFKTWTMDLQVETQDLRNDWVAALQTLTDNAKRRAQLLQKDDKGRRIKRSQSLRAPANKNQRQRAVKLPPAWTIKEEDNEEQPGTIAEEKEE